MAEGLGRHRGGIFGLILLIEEHRAALRYDWRTRFGKSLDTIPSEFDWSETLDLVRVLRADPSSQLAASIEGWAYPLERIGWMIADLIDVQGSSKVGKKWKNYPRPAAATDTVKRGNTRGMSPEDVKKILATQFGGERPSE